MSLSNAAMSKLSVPHLARILETIKPLNAFVSLCNEEDIEKSWQESQKRIEQGRPLSALDGMTLAVKDNFCMRGLPTTCASNMLR